MAAAQVQQAVVEVTVSTNPNALVQQAVVEFTVLPAAAPTSPLKITFRGAKLVPKGGRPEVCCDCPSLPPVKRAM